MQVQANPATRLHTYHNQKRQLLGNQSGYAPPAWRTAPGAPATGKKASPVIKGSKILLSQLPMDVGDNEVEVLFAKTVGPVKETFIVYNSQGKSKGMAVVAFARPEHAAVARKKYNGKIVDGRRPIKIEVIKDEDETSGAAATTAGPTEPRKPLSLLDRIAQVAPTAPTIPVAHRPATGKTATQPKAVRTAIQRPATITNPKARLRTKKGPKRIQKQQQQRKAVTAEQLDQEMEDYRASADAA